MNHKVISLDYPIKIKNSEGKELEVKQLSFGRIKTKHLELFPKGMMNSEKGEEVNFEPKEIIPLIAGLAGISIEEAGEIDFTDLLKIIDVFEDLMGKSLSLKTGKNSSTL